MARIFKDRSKEEFMRNGFIISTADYDYVYLECCTTPCVHKKGDHWYGEINQYTDFSELSDFLTIEDQLVFAEYHWNKYHKKESD